MNAPLLAGIGVGVALIGVLSLLPPMDVGAAMGAMRAGIGRMDRALGLGGRTDRAWRLVALAASTTAALVLWSAPALVLGAATVCGFGVVAARAARARARGPAADDLIEAVSAMSAALRAGSSLRQAVDRAAAREDSVAVGLRRAADTASQGVPLDLALARWAGSLGEQGRLVVHALAIASTTGAGHAGALDAVQGTLRQRDRMRDEVRALASQARASAMVLVVAPVAFATVVALVDRRVAHVLLGTALGWVCILGGLLLDLAGARWMARQIRAVA